MARVVTLGVKQATDLLVFDCINTETDFRFPNIRSLDNDGRRLPSRQRSRYVDAGNHNNCENLFCKNFLPRAALVLRNCSRYIDIQS